MQNPSKKHSEKQQVPKMVSRAFFGLILATLVFAIVPFGAVWPVPLTLATLFACFTACAGTLVYAAPVRGRWLFNTILSALAAMIAWVFLQASTVLPAVFSNPVWHDLGMLAIGYGGSVSIEPADAIYTLMYLGLPVLTFLSALTILRSDDESRRLITFITMGGAAIAIYGLLQFLLFPQTNLFLTKTAYIDSLTATFINRNSAGTFLGLVCLVLLRYGWSIQREMRFAEVILYSKGNRPSKKKALRRLLAVIMLLGLTAIALFLTKSRGAIASSFIAVAFLSFMLMAEKPATRLTSFSQIQKSRQWPIFMRLVLTIAVMAFAVVVFGGRVLMRAEVKGDDDGRFCVLPGILELVKTQPILGYGFGAFRYAFPPYRDPNCGLSLVWDRAHNSYLEGWGGLGAIFFIVLVVVLAALIIAHLIGLKTRRRMRSYASLGLASLLLVVLHAFVDFSLQIPGVATYLAALLGATSSISLRRQTNAGEETTASPALP
ncbi:O-antigen ligase family protein [Rhizobium sp. 007]|uniref:O-antigen ligase family protein n=1 Tax=Rhizobium sp. 007 TaxID=2785056 RepID=UPI00188F62B1|nr:O-antigen ligase family protein [Rhizobium sp. 007]QPB22376.1 O-antigen ligase family protein [Rhizobium sp. 007]